MPREIRADYGQQLLFPAKIDHFVGDEHPARFIQEFVDGLDLAALGFDREPSAIGRPRYAPDLLLKAVLYGWMTKVRSLRAIEVACRESTPFLFLTGMKHPDHNTLWRFFKKHRRALRRLFGETVRTSVKVGLVDMATNALDGTKIQAACSTSTGQHEAKLSRQAAKLDQAIQAAFDEIEKQARKPGSVSKRELPKELQDAQALRAKIEEARKQLAEEERAHRHPGEPDAEMMKCRNVGTQLAYNAQAVVDAKAGVVVAQAVVTDQNDQRQLVPMLKKVEETVGRLADETLADSGYHTGTAIQEAEAAGFSVLVNEPQQPAKLADKVDLRASQFIYDRATDTCTCPIGRTLKFERTMTRKQGLLVRRFRCHHGKECALAAICSRDPRGRPIEIAPFHEAVVRQRAKRQRDDKRALLGLRGQIAEWFHAQVKWVKSFRRFTMRGLDGASLQYSLVCTAHNLGIILRRRGSPVTVT